MHDDDPFDRAARRESQLRRQTQVLDLAKGMLRHLHVGVSSRTSDVEGIEDWNVMGISTIDAAGLRRVADAGRRLRIHVAGVLIVNSDVDDALWDRTVDDLHVMGLVLGLGAAGTRTGIHVGSRPAPLAAEERATTGDRAGQGD